MKNVTEVNNPSEEINSEPIKGHAGFSDFGRKNGISEICEVIEHILGLSHQVLGITTIYPELTSQRARSVLYAWRNHYLTKSFESFIAAINNNIEILDEYQPFPKEALPAKAKGVIGGGLSKSFLLSMCVFIQPEGQSEEITARRHLLRLWLLYQASIRLINDNATDANIKTVALYLIKERSDSRWVFVDKFLEIAFQELDGTEHSFDQCTLAFSRSAQYVESMGTASTRGDTRFRNAMSAIAKGQVSKIMQSETLLSPVRKFISLTLEQEQQLVLSDERQFLTLAGSLDLDESIEEDDISDVFLIQVKPEQTEGEQLLESQSILLQEREQIFYLGWSWEQILPTEVEDLNYWINEGLKNDNVASSLFYAICWLAVQFGRSLSLVMHFYIDKNINKEWTISPDFTHIRRLPIRRNSSWKPLQDSIGWIVPAGEAISVKLPNSISRALKQAAPDLTGVQQIHHIWLKHKTESIETWLNKSLPEHLSRITTAKLGNYLGNKVFLETEDPNFARMLSSHPNTGLPGACAYNTWDVDKIRAGLSLESSRPDKKPMNLIGSLLAVYEDKLVLEVSQLSDNVLQANSVVEAHNLFTQYTVWALYAATGCRHLKDPFEKLSHFYIARDYGYQFNSVYIDDKNDGIHSGRFVPMPDKAVALLNLYIKHLAKLADVIEVHTPLLAEKIRALFSNESADIPLYFLLDNTFEWHSVSKPDLPGDRLINWPLPSNVFRHRYSQVLSSSNIPVAIVEGWMGHSERGLATYGDFSLHCWKEDALKYKGVVNEVFERLPFKEIALPIDELPLTLCGSELKVTTTPAVRIFGEAERNKKRLQTLKNAREHTEKEIERFLSGRDWSAVEEAELDTLIKTLTVSDGVTSRPYALERFQVLMDVLEKAEVSHKAEIKRRVFILKQEKSRLTSKVAKALQQFPLLVEWARDEKGKRYKGSLPLNQIRMFAPVLLSIENQITYKNMLIDIARGKSFRLIQSKGIGGLLESFIEYSEELDVSDLSASIQRHKVSYKTASLLNEILKAKNETDVYAIKTPKLMDGLLDIVGFKDNEHITIEVLLDRLCKTIAQVNLITLPGMVAAGLSERQPPTSLPLQDYIRLLNGKPNAFPDFDLESEDSHELDLWQPANWKDKNSKTLKENAYIFKRLLIKKINTYKKSSAKNIAKEIEAICKENKHKVSVSVLLVGHWIAHVIKKGKGNPNNKRKVPFAESTISTYFGTLITVFEQLAYEVDLLALDTDEITRVYGRMLDYKRERDSSIGYFGARLKDFHRWSEQLGCEPVEWSELELEYNKRNVSSGFISEQDYRLCLEHIKSKYQDKEQRQALSFILILTYRFGLRANEALGLRRDDWCANNNLSWVLVQNNKYRQLKSKSSRRAIPLLFELSSIEEDIISAVLTDYNAVCFNDRSHLILSEAKDGVIKPHSILPMLAKEIIQILRSVTGNQKLVLHHCRHSFYNRVMAVLFDIDTPISQKVVGEIEKDNLINIVLGGDYGRQWRSPMAVSCLMGHAHPRTGLNNYNHLITEWADSLIPVSNLRTHKLERAFQVNQLSPWKVNKTNSKKVISHDPVTLISLFYIVRLVSSGKSFSQATIDYRLPEEVGDVLDKLFKTTTGKMTVKLRGEESRIKTLGNTQLFLSYINKDAWVRIFSVAKTYSVKPNNEIDTFRFDEVPNLIGKNRQFLMSDDGHCHLIKTVLNAFSIPDELINVAAYLDNKKATELLVRHGLPLKLHRSASSKNTIKQLDVFETYTAEGRMIKEYDYAALSLTKNDNQALRNSYELSLVVLVLSAYHYITEQLV